MAFLMASTVMLARISTSFFPFVTVLSIGLIGWPLMESFFAATRSL